MGQMGVRLINVSGEINAVRGSTYCSRTLQRRVRWEGNLSWLHYHGGGSVGLAYHELKRSLSKDLLIFRNVAAQDPFLNWSLRV